MNGLGFIKKENTEGTEIQVYTQLSKEDSELAYGKNYRKIFKCLSESLLKHDVVFLYCVSLRPL